jgi:hypothetical protein
MVYESSQTRRFAWLVLGVGGLYAIIVDYMYAQEFVNI